MKICQLGCRIHRPPIIALALCGVLTAAALCRSDDDVAGPVPPTADGPVAEPPLAAEAEDAVEANVTLEAGADTAAADDPPADEQKEEQEPAVAADAADAKPDEPKPVGKLQIRKGMGRPPGMRGGDEAMVAEAIVEIGGGIIPDTVLEPIPQEELQKQVEEHRQRMLTQLRPLLHRELYFVHLVCDTTAEERQQLLTVGESELMKLATAAAQRAGQQVPEIANNFLAAGVMMEMPATPATPETEANTRFQTSLLSAAEKTLGEQRAARLRKEFEERTAAQRRGPVDAIVTQLDAFLVLSPQQQQELRAKLLAGWREEWKTIPQSVDGRYFPDVPLPPIALTLLSDEQRRRFGAIPRARFHVQEQPVGGDAGGRPDRWKEALEQLDLAQQERGEKS